MWNSKNIVNRYRNLQQKKYYGVSHEKSELEGGAGGT
jgi:hypothetical protein